jgi:hypothetical protein
MEVQAWVIVIMAMVIPWLIDFWKAPTTIVVEMAKFATLPFLGDMLVLITILDIDLGIM